VSSPLPPDHSPILTPPDPIGFAGGTFTLPSTFPTPYFNLPEVKRALHAPANATWIYCQDPTTSPVFAGGIDTSLVSGPGSQPVLPRVIDRTRNVILGHGSRDFLLLPDATLLTIQNLTWQGALGFQRRPEGALFIPTHDNANVSTAAGGGVVGSSHSERGLTWFGAAMAGHLVGMDQPAVVFRMVEVLLGRVEGFESQEGFTVDMGLGPRPVTALGKGTVEVVEGTGAGRDSDDDGDDGEKDKGGEESGEKSKR
jgi:carboxypeptidase D